MIEVPFHKLVVAVWNNKAVACVCVLVHMGVIGNILLSDSAQSNDYISHCLYVKTIPSLNFVIRLVSWTEIQLLGA